MIGKTDFDIFPRDFAELAAHRRERRQHGDNDSTDGTRPTERHRSRLSDNEISDSRCSGQDYRRWWNWDRRDDSLENTRKELHEAMTFLDGVLEHIPASVFVKRASRPNLRARESQCGGTVWLPEK